MKRFWENAQGIGGHALAHTCNQCAYLRTSMMCAELSRNMANRAVVDLAKMGAGTGADVDNCVENKNNKKEHVLCAIRGTDQHENFFRIRGCVSWVPKVCAANVKSASLMHLMSQIMASCASSWFLTAKSSFMAEVAERMVVRSWVMFSCFVASPLRRLEVMDWHNNPTLVFTEDVELLSAPSHSLDMRGSQRARICRTALR